MSVGLCAELTYASQRFIIAVLREYVALNAELYRDGVVALAPWSLRWVPDQMQSCTVAGVCSIADTSILADAAIITRRGFASCGPLACAYAGWQLAHGVRDVDVELVPDVHNEHGSDGAWHVVAWSGGRMLDPQTIGAQ